MEQQAVLVYDGTMEGFLCCVFTAYEEKLKVVDIKPPGAAGGATIILGTTGSDHRA